MHLNNWAWILTAASLIGTIANVKRKRWCFWVWLFTNAGWTAVDIYLELYAQAALFAAYTCLAAWGLIEWKTQKEVR